MKKFLALLMVATLVFAMVGCGDSKGTKDNTVGDVVEDTDNQVDDSTDETDTNTTDEDTDIVDGEGDDADVVDNEGEDEVDNEADGEDSEDWEVTSGWSEELTAVRDAVVESLGDNYFPNTEMPAEYLEGIIGVSADTYEDFLGEMPLISTNVDMLVVIKPADGQADAVEEALNAYRDRNIEDSFQYPMNVGKVQASVVARAGEYVVFVQLGGEISDIAEQGDEAVVEHCQQINNDVVTLITELQQAE